MSLQLSVPEPHTFETPMSTAGLIIISSLVLLFSFGTEGGYDFSQTPLLPGNHLHQSPFSPGSPTGVCPAVPSKTCAQECFTRCTSTVCARKEPSPNVFLSHFLKFSCVRFPTNTLCISGFWWVLGSHLVSANQCSWQILAYHILAMGQTKARAKLEWSARTKLDLQQVNIGQAGDVEAIFLLSFGYYCLASYQGVSISGLSDVCHLQRLRSTASAAKYTCIVA